MDNNERQLSPREQEQMEIIAGKIKHARDQVDELWPDVAKAAALAKDCFEALKKEGFPDGYAISLVGSLMHHLKR